MAKACTRVSEIAPYARQATKPRRGMRAATGETDFVSAMRVTSLGPGLAVGLAFNRGLIRGTAKDAAMCGRGLMAGRRAGLGDGGTLSGAAGEGLLGEAAAFISASRICRSVSATAGRISLVHSIVNEAPI